MKKILSLVICGVLFLTLITGCGSSSEEDAAEPAPFVENSDYTDPDLIWHISDGWTYSNNLIVDARSNFPMNFGGMEIEIIDWWSDPNADDVPTSDYEDDVYEYHEWLKDTYNFKVKRGSDFSYENITQAYCDYVEFGQYKSNTIWVLHDDNYLSQAFSDGYMYDLATIDILDFDSYKFYRNRSAENYSDNEHIYSMAAGINQSPLCLVFNEDILRAYGINPDSIYEMQADGTWTWDEFEKILENVQVDEDGDGLPEYYGFAGSCESFCEAAVYSNGGGFVGIDEEGYTLLVNSDQTREALEWSAYILDVFFHPSAVYDFDEIFLYDGAAFTIGCAEHFDPCMIDSDSDYGIVAFPKGPDNAEGKYTIPSKNYPVVIPACYDEDTAWKLAFVWSMWNTPPAGYEDYDPNMYTYYSVYSKPGVEALLEMNGTASYIVSDKAQMIPELDIYSQLLAGFYMQQDASMLVNQATEKWREYIAAENEKNQ